MDRQMDRDDCITSRANAFGKYIVQGNSDA